MLLYGRNPVLEAVREGRVRVLVGSTAKMGIGTNVQTRLAALHHLDADGRLARWLPKSAFLRGAAAAPLQAVRGGWQGQTLVLTHPDLPPLAVDPDRDPQALVDWVAPLWAATGKPAPARLVEGPQPLADVKQPVVSLLSLTSLAELERRLGRPLGTDRWRGNLWIDGWAPFAEHDLRLRTLRIGAVVLKLTERIDRCPATSADTRTGRLDGDMPAELRQAVTLREIEGWGTRGSRSSISRAARWTGSCGRGGRFASGLGGIGP